MNTGRTRLALIYLIQFFTWGTVTPVISLFLKNEIGFTGTQTGIIISMSAIPVFISPFISSLIVDRFISSKHMVIVNNLVAAVTLFFLLHQEQFIPFLSLYLLYMLINQPLSGLINSITFFALKDSKKDYGKMRVWGTVGWAMAGWIFGIIGLLIPGVDLKVIMSIGVATFVLQAINACFLPGRKKSKMPARIFPAGVFKAFFKKPVIFMVITCLFVYIVDTLYYFGISIHLSQTGIAHSQVMSIMSIGQATEIAAMFLLGVMLTRFSFRTVLRLGLLMEVCRFFFLTISHDLPGLITGIIFHGPAYAFFFATAYIYIDTHLDENRVSITPSKNMAAISVAWPILIILITWEWAIPV